MITFPENEVLGVIVSILLVLLIGSVGRWAALRTADPRLAFSRMGSLKTWWVLFLLTSAAVVVGRLGVVLWAGTASLLGMREYLHLTAPTRRASLLKGAVLTLVPIHYALILLDWQAGFPTLLPVGAVLLIGSLWALGGHTRGYVRTVGGTLFGLLVTVYLLSHSAMLFTLPAVAGDGAGPAGWFLYLVLLTEINDISQALTGRRLGKNKVCPHVSPHKTWEGLFGGMLVTLGVAMALAPWLTPLTDQSWLRQQQVPWPWPYFWAGIVGLAISLLGFCGDITMSAVKRDAGVKDGSHLLPGQGGIIDRIDSLTFTSPAMYYFVRWLTETPTGAGL